MAQRGPIVHPFLFAIYPILYLWSNNQDELSLYSSTADLIVPMVIATAAALVLLALTGLILRNWREAGLIVALSLIMFFSYGHVHTTIADFGRFGYPEHRYLLSIWVALFALGSLLSLLYRSDLSALTSFLNIVAGMLVAFSLASIVSHEPLSAATLADANVSDTVTGGAGQEQLGGRPDIYYISVEGY